MKKTQKTHIREIEKAKRGLANLKKGVLIMNNSVIVNGWEDVRKELFTPEEIAESNQRVSIIGELIKARQEKGSTSPN